MSEKHVHHKDGDPTNNEIENLEVVIPRDNQFLADAVQKALDEDDDATKIAKGVIAYGNVAGMSLVTYNGVRTVGLTTEVDGKDTIRVMFIMIPGELSKGIEHVPQSGPSEQEVEAALERLAGR